MQDEVLDADSGHDDAESEGQVAVYEQVMSFVGSCPVPLIVVAPLQGSGAARGGGVEVVPPPRGGEDEPRDADGERGSDPHGVVHASGRASHGLPENQDDKQSEPFREMFHLQREMIVAPGGDDGAGSVGGNRNGPQPVPGGPYDGQ